MNDRATRDAWMVIAMVLAGTGRVTVVAPTEDHAKRVLAETARLVGDYPWLTQKENQ